MKNSIIYYFLIVASLFACKKSSTPTPTVAPGAAVLAVPVVSTIKITSISSTASIGGGHISSDGGAAIIKRGICWSTLTKPTIVNNYTLDGIDTGVYISSLKLLTPGTKYYVRAYATNSIGTAYGNEITFETKLIIGDKYQGGIVAYILQKGDLGFDSSIIHGIIAADIDGQSLKWDNGNNTVTGANGTAIGTGKTNTNKIIATEGAGNYAARYCYDLVRSGYDDWYLPSLDELKVLYANRAAINPNNKIFQPVYWSSTEHSQSGSVYSWAIYFNYSNLNGTATDIMKKSTSAIRAIRYF